MNTAAIMSQMMTKMRSEHFFGITPEVFSNQEHHRNQRFDYSAQIGERAAADGSMTGSVTFLKWLPAFCRSRVHRDVHHSLQESDGCALWKLINKVREQRVAGLREEPEPSNAKVGHLTVSEGLSPAETAATREVQ
eukprot:s259_g12.t1